MNILDIVFPAVIWFLIGAFTTLAVICWKLDDVIGKTKT